MEMMLTEENFDSTISKGIAVIDFTAPWCGPCKMLSPIIDKIAENNPDIIVAKVDIDQSPAITLRYNVMSIPTILIFKDGEPKEQTVGVVSEKVIMQKVDSLRG